MTDELSVLHQSLRQKLQLVNEDLRWFERSVTRSGIILGTIKLLTLIVNFSIALIVALTRENYLETNIKILLISLPFVAVLLNGIVSEFGLQKWVLIREQGRLECLELKLVIEDVLQSTNISNIEEVLKNTSRQLVEIEKKNGAIFLKNIPLFKLNSDTENEVKYTL